LPDETQLPGQQRQVENAVAEGAVPVAGAAPGAAVAGPVLGLMDRATEAFAFGPNGA
jgi:hypothetical protein